MEWTPTALVRKLAPAIDWRSNGERAQAIAQEPASWRAVAEASGAVFVQWDLRRGRMVDISENVVNLLGYTRGEFLRDGTLFQRVTPEEAALSINEMIASWSRSKPARVRFEETFVDRRGRPVVLEMTGALEYGSNRELVGARLMAVDVTDIVNARGTAQAGLERYRSVFEACPMAMWVLDPDTFTIVHANEQACQLYGVPRDRLEGSSLMARVVPGERAALEERVRAATVGGRFDVIPRSLRLRGDQTIVPVSLVAGNVVMDGKVRRLVLARDISEEDRLRGWTARYRDAFQKAPAALFVLDRHSLVVLEANDRAVRMYGLPLEQLEGAQWSEATGDGAGAIEARTLAEKLPEVGQFVRRTHHRRSDGVRFPVEVAMIPIEGESDGRWLAVVTDRSDQQVAELSTAAMRMAADAADLAVLFLDAAGRVLYASAAVGWLCGRAPADILGRTSIDLLAAGDELAWVAGLRRVLEGGKWTGSLRIGQTSGASRAVHVRMAGIFGTGDERPAFILATLEPSRRDGESRTC